MQLFNSLGAATGMLGAGVGAGAGIYSSSQTDDLNNVGSFAGTGAAIGGVAGYAGGAALSNLGAERGINIATSAAKGIALQPLQAYYNSFKFASGADRRIGTLGKSFGATTGVMGSAAGTYLGSKLSGGDAQGTVVGAAVGAGIGAAAPLIGGAVTAGVGMGAFALAKRTPDILAKTGQGMFTGGKILGGVAGAIALPVGHEGAFKQSELGKWRDVADQRGLGNKAKYLGGKTANFGKRAMFHTANPVQKYGQIGSSLMGSLFRYEGEKHEFKNGKMKSTPGRLRLTKRGMGVGIVGMIAASGVGAAKDFDNRRGQSAGVQTATPRPYSFENNGGANGDLVFALHNNR